MEENIANSTQNTEQVVSEQTTETGKDVNVQENPGNLLSQGEVNRIVSGRVKEVTQKLWEKYGVASDEELDGLIVKGQEHSALQEQLSAREEELAVFKAQKTLRLNKVRGDKADDVIALLKGKNLPITEENVKEVLDSHPEWKRKRKQKAVANIGATQPKEKPLDEKEIARSFFRSLNK